MKYLDIPSNASIYLEVLGFREGSSSPPCTVTHSSDITSVYLDYTTRTLVLLSEQHGEVYAEGQD